MKRTLVLGLALWAVGCGAIYTVDVPGKKPLVTVKKAAPLQFSAWMVYWDELSPKSFEANVSRLTRVYPEAYTVQSDGLPGRIPMATPQLLAGTVALAHAHGVKVLGIVNNYAHELGDFDQKRVQLFLNDHDLMARHVDALLALVKADGMDGIDADYESLAAVDRGNYTLFIQLLCARAHAQGLLVGVALHPKESEPGNWAAPQAQDYAALGAACDWVHLMTYDFHWATGGAGSVAPLGWVRSVGAFAASKIPKEKIELGVNGYGYVWKGKGETLTWPKFLDLQSKVGKAERDESSSELKLFFPGGEAWMSDAETTRQKFDIASDLGVAGVAMWVLGQEDPKTWMVWDKYNAGTK